MSELIQILYSMALDSFKILQYNKKKWWTMFLGCICLGDKFDSLLPLLV